MASPRLTEPPLARLDRQVNGKCALPSGEDRDAILNELEKILASPAFRNSKRYSNLLKHVVERALEGRSEDLKERNIGVDVFGRAPDYDTNSDHVVRSVAREVRRGLAQYYLDEGRDAEVRIDLLPGSYVPQFRRAEVPTAVPKPITPPPAPVARRQSTMLIAGIILGAALVATASFAWLTPATAFDRFWNPFLGSSTAALLCVGGGGQQSTTTDVLA